MTVSNLGDDTTRMTVDAADLVVERIFEAPRELVWTAITSPEHIARWWGRTGTTTKVVELDLRPGGRWRYIAQTADGHGEAPFTGEHLEIVPPERIVRTVVFDVAPFNGGPPAIETLTLEVLDGRTRLRSCTRFPSEEILNGALYSGVAAGTIEEYDRLARLLTEMPRD